MVRCYRERLEVTILQTGKITLDGSPKAAQAFRGVSPKERERIRNLVEVSRMTQEEAAQELECIMDDMSRTARERGLTDELLNDK